MSSAEQQSTQGPCHDDVTHSLPSWDIGIAKKMGALAYFAGIAASVLLASASMAQTKTEPSPPPPKLWEDAGWKRCLSDFTKRAKTTTHGDIVRYIGSKCLPHKNRLENPPGSTCFMEAVGPSELLSSTKVEVKLICTSPPAKHTGAITSTMVCTNKKGHYMPQMTNGMTSDSRCVGFPELLAVSMGRDGRNRALDKIIKQPTQSVECRVQKATIDGLENRPDFDTNQRVREAWSSMVQQGIGMGCRF